MMKLSGITSVRVISFEVLTVLFKTFNLYVRMESLSIMSSADFSTISSVSKYGGISKSETPSVLSLLLP